MKYHFLFFICTLFLNFSVAPVLAQVNPPILKIEGGGTGASNAGAARLNLGAAALGANSDITSLSGLTTPLPVSEGGTGSTSGVSPTGSLTSTPESVINVVDYGGCSGSTAMDTANLNAALSAARSSSAYMANQPVRVIGGFSKTQMGCAVTQINATGFTRFGSGSRLILEDITIICSGIGNICIDTLGSLNVQFNKVTIIGSSSSPPMIGLQEGNISPSNTACCIHTNYSLEITGSFTFSGIYSAAAESTTYYSPIVRNNGASLGVIGTLGTIAGGGGYANGTYTNIALTGSATGYGAVANIVVSGGAVTSVIITNQGRQFAIGDKLTVAAGYLGSSGSGFSVNIANIGQFAFVMDGQNHWGLSSAFQSINWPQDTYYTFTENNIIGGSLRYYGSTYNGAPLWVGSVEGLRTVHLYIAQQASGPCVSLFDNNAAYTSHNIGEILEIQCETASANYDVQLTGSNSIPNVSGLSLIDQQTTVNSAILGVDVGIKSVTAHNSFISVARTTQNVPLFSIGSANLWNFDGSASLPLAYEYNAPATALVSGISGGVPIASAGPLDFLNSISSVAGAYSCARRLSFAYIGPLCNIRRSSDSSSIDFYPNPSGVIDKSAIDVFCQSTTCYIAIEYDQTGNGNHAKNATFGNQPIVVMESSVMNYSICGAWGNGSNVSLNVSANNSINNFFSAGGFVSAVSNRTANITNSMRLLSKVSSGSGWEISGSYTLGYGYPQFTIDASSVNGAWVGSVSMPLTGAHIFDIIYSNSSPSNVPSLGVDGSLQTFQSSVQPAGTINDINNLVIGNVSSGGYGWPGDICEVILARQNMNATQVEAIRRNQAIFYNINGVL